MIEEYLRSNDLELVTMGYELLTESNLSPEEKNKIMYSFGFKTFYSVNQASMCWTVVYETDYRRHVTFNFFLKVEW